MDFRAKIRDALEGKKAKSGMDSMGNPFVDLPGKHVPIEPEDTIDDIKRKLGTAKMSITGLKSGAFQDMLVKMRQEIADAQNQGVNDVMAAKDQAAAEIKSTIAGVKDKIKSEVADALQEFSEFTNGGPA